MKFNKVIPFIFSLATTTFAQSFCSNAKHTGQKVTETKSDNKLSSIDDIDYQLWFEGGKNSATFYSDGSFSCSFNHTMETLCSSGFSFDSTKTHEQLGHMYADFKLVKQNVTNVDYSHIGIEGLTKYPLVEYYIIDNWLTQDRPGDWIGRKKHGDFIIDDAKYTIYEDYTPIVGVAGEDLIKKYFSVRQEPRDCGTIDITAHIQQWGKLGMRLGKVYRTMISSDVYSNYEKNISGTNFTLISGGASGTIDFPYAKVYISNNSNDNPNDDKTVNVSNTCSPKITDQGYQCCSDDCEVVYVDSDGDWDVENNQWCGCRNK